MELEVQWAEFHLQLPAYTQLESFTSDETRGSNATSQPPLALPFTTSRAACSSNHPSTTPKLACFLLSTARKARRPIALTCIFESLHSYSGCFSFLDGLVSNKCATSRSFEMESMMSCGPGCLFDARHRKYAHALVADSVNASSTLR